MDRRMVVSVVSMITAAACLTVGSAVFTGSGAHADGAKARVRESSDKKPETAPPLESVAPTMPPASVAPAPTVPVGPPPVAPVPPPAAAYTPAYPVTPANMSEPRDGSLTVQEILQLRALKKRIGGENFKRVIDALGD